MKLANQVYQQAATQMELYRAKIQEDKPVFAVVEPATVPLVLFGSKKGVDFNRFYVPGFCRQFGLDSFREGIVGGLEKQPEKQLDRAFFWQFLILFVSLQDQYKKWTLNKETE